MKATHERLSRHKRKAHKIMQPPMPVQEESEEEQEEQGINSQTSCPEEPAQHLLSLQSKCSFIQIATSCANNKKCPESSRLSSACGQSETETERKRSSLLPHFCKVEVMGSTSWLLGQNVKQLKRTFSCQSETNDDTRYKYIVSKCWHQYSDSSGLELGQG